MKGTEDPWAQHRGDAAVLATRARIAGKVVEILRACIAQPPSLWRQGADYVSVAIPTPRPLRSMMLSVAQYWADNADDEVHLFVSGSTAETPAWPHACDELPPDQPIADPFEGCTSCVEQIEGTWSWGYGELIPAFEAFCGEGANQDMETRESHRPYLIVRLGADGAPVFEHVGHVVRPWLDRWQDVMPAMPEVGDRIIALASIGDVDVLRDALLEANDPRGELLVQGAPALARAWLGAFDRFVPRSGIVLARGIPTDIELYLDDATMIDRDDRLPWAFGPRVRFLGGPGTHLDVDPWPALAPARALGPLGPVALESIATGPTKFHAELLELDPLEPEYVALVATPNLPRVRRLVVHGMDARIAPHVAQLPLAHLEVTTTEDVDHVAAGFRAAHLPFPVTVATLDVQTYRASRWHRRIRIESTGSR